MEDDVIYYKTSAHILLARDRTGDAVMLIYHEDERGDCLVWYCKVSGYSKLDGTACFNRKIPKKDVEWFTELTKKLASKAGIELEPEELSL